MLSFNVNAQQVGSFWITGIAGVNSTWILNQNAYGNQEMEYATSFGLTGGVGVNYFYSKDWGINGSMILSKLGQNYAGDQGGAMTNRKVKLDYLEVPLLLVRQLSYTNSPTWIAAGPDIMVLLKARQEYSRAQGGQALPNPAGMQEGDITDRFKPLDIALNFSLNQMVSMNYTHSLMFLFSVNSSIGITDINKADWQIPNTHNSYAPSHNFYIGFKVGIMYKAARFGGPRW